MQGRPGQAGGFSGRRTQTLPPRIAMPHPGPPPGPRSLLPPSGAPFWVFGYGSLMWDPGFAYEERSDAVLHGWHRRFCIVSHRYRGTPERPGLVLGLDRGGSCRGVAFRVAEARWEETAAYLWEREMLYAVYRPQRGRLRLGDETVEAAFFVANRAHPHFFADASDPGRCAAVIGSAAGQRGRNLDYLLNTLAHLAGLGIRDRHLEAIAALIVGADRTPSA